MSDPIPSKEYDKETNSYSVVGKTFFKHVINDEEPDIIAFFYESNNDYSKKVRSTLHLILSYYVLIRINTFS